MRKYTAEQYIKLVENINDDILQTHMKAEMDIISQVKNSKNKTFIDLGAGHGRILPELVKFARNVISIDFNPDMLVELKRRTKMYDNASVIEGDMQELSGLLEKADVQNPVLLIIQNTLGTIEGDYKKVLSEMKVVAQRHKGEVIISLFRQEALRDWGIKLYSTIKEMVGEPDLERTDFEKGLFVSKTGYISKWWTFAEIKEIKDFFGGKILKEVLTPNFAIIHISLR
jgi:ubiquinone/menaquinone biosynthesis C-methylase UbiE